jgi:hypothetical protein
MSAEREMVLAKRRRGIILKLVRQGHENQFSRLDDFELFAMMQELGQSVGRDQVLTLIQDLGVLEYVDYKQKHNEISGRTEISQIELTKAGLRFVTAGRSNEDVLFG